MNAVDQTIAKTAAFTSLSTEACKDLRYMAYAHHCRAQTSYVYSTQEVDHVNYSAAVDELIAAELITVGRHHYRDGSPVKLTVKGIHTTGRIVRYETAIRRRHMDADDLKAWQVAAAAKLPE